MTEQKKGPVARVMVATPIYDTMVNYRYLESYIASVMHCFKNRIEVYFTPATRFTLVQYARNYLLKLFLDEPDFTHMMWIDSDLGWDPTAIARLVSHGKDVVGGVYPVKAMNLKSWYPYAPVTDVLENGLQRCEHLPGGFMLVSRRAAEAVARTCPTYTLHHDGKKIPCANVFDLEHTGDNFTGEDIVHCNRLRKCGFDIWADPDISFAHCGQFEWVGNLKASMAQWEKAKQDGTAPSKEEVMSILPLVESSAA